MTNIARLADQPFGAEVMELDLSQLLDSAAVGQLQHALPQHRALCFPDQDIGAEDFVRFSRMFGRPHPHVLEHLRLDGHPEILLLTNIVEDDSKPNGHNGAAFWHTDNSYEAEHASATMLYARSVPETGGETLLCDMAAAFQGLPEKQQKVLEGLTVRHRYGNRDAGVENDAGRLQKGQETNVPEVTHSLVKRHPVSGERCLYAVAASARGIVGMPDDEALDLLNELKQHCTRPAWVISKRYRVGDVFIWDTLLTMHAAAIMDVARDTSNTRIMHRISVKGYPAAQDHPADQTLSGQAS